MKRRYLPGTYLSKNTVLHTQPIPIKIGLLALYMILLIIIRHPAILTILIGSLLIGTIMAKLENRGWLLLIGLGVITSIIDLINPPFSIVSIFSRLLTLVLKVSLFNRLINLYGQTTSILETLHWVQTRSQARWLREWAYLISTSMSIYPSIRRDLAQATDAEHLRLGQYPNFLQWKSWFSILISTLVRVINRAHRIGQSAVDRGFNIDKQFTQITQISTTQSNWLITIFCLLPAIVTLSLWLTL